MLTNTKNAIEFYSEKFKFQAKRSLSKPTKHTNVIIFSDKLWGIPDAQIFPFYFYKKQLSQQYNIHFAEISTNQVQTLDLKENKAIKCVFYQPAQSISDNALIEGLQRLRLLYPNASLCFFDWYAPLHLNKLEIVHPFIDFYIKKQVFSDLNNYQKPTIGENNLTDFYSKKYNLEDAIHIPALPTKFESKLIIGSGFYLSSQLTYLFNKKQPATHNRTIDLNSRLAIDGAPWYKAMRTEAQQAINALTGVVQSPTGRVRRHEFISEMLHSKVCFSPFGYGEVCWRDYEAFATGALLLKPNMDHIRVTPDAFIPFETYVPLEWDFSDFQEKFSFYLNNNQERQRITSNAFQLIHDYIAKADYVNTIAHLVHSR